MAQELKSNLKPNINDTLIHCPEASTTWLLIARSTFTDSFLPSLLGHVAVGALQGMWNHWGTLIRMGGVPSCCQCSS